MARQTMKIAPNQLPLDFAAQVDTYVEARTEILEAIQERPASPVDNEFEACIEIAAAVKKAVRDSGMSREQLVDAINAYFGRTEEGAEADPPTCRKPLTLNQINHYLSKPTEYPIPAYYLFALHHVTGVIEPGATIIAAAGGQVATAEEMRLLQLGKLEQTLDEMRRLRSELRGRARR
ncbi:MAG: hypothetical protein IH614_19215 [Desulfuromonadales bacterium]|nr:hypothetical protein [Desulfuromonadales bacterium]